MDLSKVKNKLKTGEHRTGDTLIYDMVGWPQDFVNKLYAAPVAHGKLTPQLYFSGTINGFLADLEPEVAAISNIENKLKFLSSLANQALISPWEDILALSASFYRSLEQKALSWDDMGAIQTWWDRSLDSLKYRSITDKSQNNGNNPNKRPRPDVNSDGPAPKFPRTHLAGLPIDWMKANNICMKHQTGNCDKSSDHTTANGNYTLRHICGGCLKLGKPEDSSHSSAKNCPNRDLFFC